MSDVLPAGIGTLLPAGIDPWAAGALIVLSCFTSLLTAAVGLGGGLLMLAAMTFVVPVEALIPVHGVVQLGSNLGRSFILARSAARRVLVPFAFGAVVGAAVGALVVTDLPIGVLTTLIGGFVLVMTWVKLPPLGRGETGVVGIGGAVATVLTMFVGATGPFVMALFQQSGLSHRELVATSTVAMTMQHSLKTMAFGLIGFAFAAWVPLMAAMIVAGFVGTTIGARLLDTLPEKSLKRALKFVLTAVAVQLLVEGLLGLL